MRLSQGNLFPNPPTFSFVTLPDEAEEARMKVERQRPTPIHPPILSNKQHKHHQKQHLDFIILSLVVGWDQGVGNEGVAKHNIEPKGASYHPQIDDLHDGVSLVNYVVIHSLDSSKQPFSSYPLQPPSYTTRNRLYHKLAHLPVPPLPTPPTINNKQRDLKEN